MTGGISPERIRYIACEFNLAHRHLGTRLVSVHDDEVTLQVPWQDSLSDGGGGMSSFAIVAALDHACALAALIHVGDEERGGSTLSLRIDHLEPAQPGQAVTVVAKTLHANGEGTVVVQGRASNSDRPDPLLALAISTVAVTP